LMRAGHYMVRFYPDRPTRFGIIPRRGASEDIRWFEADPTFVLHWINAFEDGDEIVLDGFFQSTPSPERDPALSVDQNIFRYLDLHAMGTRAHRWRFDLKTGQCREERLSDRIMEFGMINGRYGGRHYRYCYNALPAEGWFGFEGIVKHDLHTGSEQVVRLPKGVYASETVMAPRVGSTGEDDGYLVTFTMDMNEDRSECLILDAAAPCDEPIARISLPERMSSGTHACWLPGTQPT
jgi:carotenoid cleavage dioxygenase-like enzyme